ncbi:MAG TPA: glycosyltransferase [Anaerolineae bacterium]|nr:glycosyltransferase [Anaerolineae bacterium]
MRLIVTTSSYPTRVDEAINAGGFVRDIVVQLVQLGHSVNVLTPDKGEPITGSPVPVHTFRWGGVERVLTRLNPRHPADSLRMACIMLGGCCALKRVCAQVQAEAILAMWAVPSGYWASSTGLPYAVWTLGSDIWGIGRYLWGKAIVRRVLRRAGYVFSDGLHLADEVSRLTGRRSEFLASCRTLPVESTPAAQLPENRLHLLFIGRWDRAKGVDILLEAMEIVLQRVPHVQLHLFGGGSLEKPIRWRASQGRLRDGVTVYGFADPATATAYLKACDVLVIPSRLESIPVIYSDALQCGCPVVATDVGDLGQIVRQHGTGLVCPPEDSDALAESLCVMASGGPRPRAQYAEALSHAVRLFQPSRSAARCAEVLAQLIVMRNKSNSSI